MTSKKVKQHIISEKTSENVEFKAADEIYRLLRKN
jgi:hypothetical protein